MVALVWGGAIWLTPVGGSPLFLGALATGVGGWRAGAWDARKDERGAALPALTAAPRQPSVPADWDAPLAPEVDADGEEE